MDIDGAAAEDTAAGSKAAATLPKTDDEVTALASLLCLQSLEEGFAPTFSALEAEASLNMWSLPDADANAAAILSTLETRARRDKLAATGFDVDDDVELVAPVIDAEGLPEGIRRRPDDKFDLAQALRQAGLYPESPNEHESKAEHPESTDKHESKAEGLSGTVGDRIPSERERKDDGAAAEVKEGTNTKGGVDLLLKSDAVRAYEELLSATSASDAANATGKRSRLMYNATKATPAGTGSDADTEEATTSTEGIVSEKWSAQYAALDAMEVAAVAEQLRKANEAALAKQAQRGKEAKSSDFHV